MHPLEILAGRDFDAEIERERAAARVARSAEAFPLSEVVGLLAQAREEGLAEGRRAGMDEGLALARKDVSASVAAVLSRLSSETGSLLESLEDHRLKVEDDVANFFLALLERAVPELLSGYHEDRIRSEAAAIARRAQGSRWLELRVSPEVSAQVRQALEDALPGGGGIGDIRVVPDAAMEQAEMSASWQGGRSEHSHTRLCDRLIETMRADIAARKARKDKDQ